MPASETPDLETLRRQFAAGDRWFNDSPLYQTLTATVARDDALLEIASHARAGQQPLNLMMAATHRIVARDPTLPFARFFPTVAGAEAEPPDGAAPEYAGFCTDHREALIELLETRLVQTNEPARATAIRFALHEVGRRAGGPVTFLEIGPSAGIQLRFDRWGVCTGGRRFGPADPALTVETEWRDVNGPPDLDAIVPIRERFGVDLHPVDATDPEERRWLQALVWPEHVDRHAQLGRALDAVAANPPEIIGGDAIELLPQLDLERIAADADLVVFHSMVRIHVPRERRRAFDGAITALAARRRLFHISLEHSDRGPALLTLSDSAGKDAVLARAHGHGRWIAPGAGIVERAWGSSASGSSAMGLPGVSSTDR
ncbi:MAG TPA: DUF2332 domain-containing protein [Solirubrobacteraceae bacterium]|nr:DUF2332 domain-containing protein [Solirubrobacteraceae bacterium]